MDPLSDVLSLLNPRSVLSASLAAGGGWAIRFAAHEGVKFGAVTRGGCWLAVDGTAPVRLEAGDCYLLTRGRPYLMGDDLSLAPADAHAVFGHAVDRVARHGSADALYVIGGRFSFDADHAALLTDALPPVIHVRAGSEPASALRWMLEQLAHELSAARDGAPLMANHLAHLMLVQVLRAYAAAPEEGQPAGWLGALSDERIGAALRQMHAQPARRWTLAELAQAAGMSRSRFALRFKQAVGSAPLDYLLRWRMRLAGQALCVEGRSVSAVALSLGYESDSAFSHAFKRVMGCAPKHFVLAARRERGAAAMPAAAATSSPRAPA